MLFFIKSGFLVLWLYKSKIIYYTIYSEGSNMIPCEVIELKKLFGSIVGVDGVNLNAKEGEILGLIGPNGAGKTTTIRSIVGLIKPTSGEVAIFNEKAFTDGYKVRGELGYASGETSLIPNLSVRENLKFVADIKGVSMDRVDYLATKLELNLTRKAKDLSLGNKKKLGIVLALLSSPKLIILDEPTSGLDPLIRQKFFDLMEEEKKRGASIIISSHELTEIQRLCDRVAIIKDGKVIAIEEMEELKTKRLKNIVIETDYSEPNITIAGVSNVKRNGKILSFDYNGEMPQLIKYLNSIDLVNIDIKEASLENIFMHFYSGSEYGDK